MCVHIDVYICTYEYVKYIRKSSIGRNMGDVIEEQGTHLHISVPMELH